MCQKSNSRSVREKNHRKSGGMHRKHIGLMTSQSAKIRFAQSKTRILHSIFHPYFKGASFKWSSTLFMLTSDGSGRLTVCVTKCIIIMHFNVIQPISCCKKMSFEDFFQAKILLWSGVEPVYSLLNLIHFHMNALTYPWEIVKISIIITW